MPFTEKYQENKENEESILPIDVNSPEKLERYLSFAEPFSEDFKLQKGKERNLVDELDENDNGLIYRGMSPEDVFQLLRTEKINIKPYKYNPDNPPEEELQNASFLYSNAIMYGYDRRDYGYNFLSAVGFKPVGIILQKTGRRMAERFAGAGDISSVPENKEKDVTVKGDLDVKNIQVFCFRFRIGDSFKTLVYRRTKESRQENWMDYLHQISDCIEKDDSERLENLLMAKHPVLPVEKEAYMWLKENPKLKHKPRIKLDKTDFHVVPVRRRKK